MCCVPSNMCSFILFIPWLCLYDYSFSDWNIRIRIVSNRTTSKGLDDTTNNRVPDSSRIYHVHRNILAIGERRSGYFANLLHYGIDDGRNSSDVELCSRAAAYFPDLLDYLYSSKAFTITTSNAVALFYLSQAFQVESLESSIEKFIKRDVKLFNFGRYMSEALYFGDETMAVNIINICENEAMLLLYMHNNNSNSNYRFKMSGFSSAVLKAEEKCENVRLFVARNLSCQRQIVSKLFGTKNKY